MFEVLRKSKIDLDDTGPLYDAYKRRVGPNYWRALSSGFVIRASTGVSLTSLGIAPGVKDVVRQAREDKRSVMMLFTHQSHSDPPAATDLLLRSSTFRFMLGNTFVGANDKLFAEDGVEGAAKRLMIAGQNAIPFIRGKDRPEEEQRQPDFDRKIARAGANFASLSVELMNWNMNMAAFASKETNDCKGNPAKQRDIPPVSKAVASIALRCDVQPLVVPAGIYYRDYVDGKGNEKQPSIYIGMPPAESYTRRDEFVAALHPALTNATAAAQHIALAA